MFLAVNAFAKRQTADSPFSYSVGTFADLIEIVTKHWDNRTPGRGPGIWNVPVPAAGFYSGVIAVQRDTVLKSDFVQRAPNEDFHVRTLGARNAKPLATSVTIIVYSHEALGAEASTDAAFEIVSINASLYQTADPPTPLSMARNMLGKAGGTPAVYTAQEFADAIWFWSHHVMSA